MALTVNVEPRPASTQHLEDFLAYCRRTRRAAEETIAWYRRRITRFIESPAAHGSSEDFMDWIQGLAVGSDATRAGYWRAVRAFLRWAEPRGFALDVTRHIKPRWSIEPHRMPPESAAFWSILAAMALDSYTEKRNRVLFCCTFFACCRVSEIGSLAWSQIDAQGRVIRVIGKGRKWRIIPAHPQLIAMLEAWRPSAPGKYIFPRSAEDDRPLHRTRLSHLWRETQLTQGIKDPWSFHDIRRAGASWLARNGMSLFAVQQLLGHTDIRTTQTYLSMDTVTLQREMRAAWKNHAAPSP